MEPKFIITEAGFLRIGFVRMHRDLLLPSDRCIGGGLWSIDYPSSCLRLEGKSYDYDRPQWFLLDTLYVPAAYRGLRIDYKGGSFLDDFDVSTRLQIIYV